MGRNKRLRSKENNINRSYKMKALKLYLKHVELFQKGMGIPKREELKKMAEAYDKELKDPALPKTNIGCAPCVKNMMNRIQGAINRGEFRTPLKKYTDSVKELEDELFPDEDTKTTVSIDPSKMKWGELKSYAKEQGINTKGMKKAEILEALN